MLFFCRSVNRLLTRTARGENQFSRRTNSDFFEGLVFSFQSEGNENETKTRNIIAIRGSLEKDS